MAITSYIVFGSRTGHGAYPARHDAAQGPQHATPCAPTWAGSACTPQCGFGRTTASGLEQHLAGAVGPMRADQHRVPGGAQDQDAVAGLVPRPRLLVIRFHGVRQAAGAGGAERAGARGATAGQRGCRRPRMRGPDGSWPSAPQQVGVVVKARVRYRSAHSDPRPPDPSNSGRRLLSALGLVGGV